MDSTAKKSAPQRVGPKHRTQYSQNCRAPRKRIFCDGHLFRKLVAFALSGELGTVRVDWPGVRDPEPIPKLLAFDALSNEIGKLRPRAKS